MLAELNNPNDGVDMAFFASNINTGQLANHTLELRPTGDSISTSAPLNSQISKLINNQTVNGDITRVGEYGAHFLSEINPENVQNNLAGLNGYIGILTDDDDKPAEGNATYSGSSRAIYQNRESTTDITYTGTLNTAFTANFTNNIITGAAAGNVTQTNDSNVTLPITITYNPAVFQNSSFQSSATADIDNKNIAMNYHGAFFGPQAQEMGYVAGNNSSSDITLLDYGYFVKQ
jgi:hypothetical protein